LRFNLIAGLYNYELRRSSVNEISNSYVWRLAIAFFRPHSTPATDFCKRSNE
jgi:hypothetical protein